MGLIDTMFQTNESMTASVIIIFILCIFIYNVLNSLFTNAFRKQKIKVVKIYVDEFGEEIKVK